MNPANRVELQGTYSRGHSIDARSLGSDVINGRPIAQSAVDGLLYESIGGRVTVEPISRVHIYGGYSRDKNNRDTAPTGRTLIGGYASNVAKSGIDISASDSLMNRPTGSYHSRYVSAGRQIGRTVYVSGDYSTSLSVVRFSRSDGITIETRPHTTRFSGTTTVIVGRSVSVLATVEHTRDDQVREFRILVRPDVPNSMITTKPDPTAERRAAIEEELRVRLARDRSATRGGPLSVVRLMCLECRAVTSADAQFCTRCGTRFNALVVVPANAPPDQGAQE